MFIIIKDVKLAQEYAEAGLLWWVGAGDGGPDHIITWAYGRSLIAAHVHNGIVGILVEE